MGMETTVEKKLGDLKLAARTASEAYAAASSEETLAYTLLLAAEGVVKEATAHASACRVNGCHSGDVANARRARDAAGHRFDTAWVAAEKAARAADAAVDAFQASWPPENVRKIDD